MHPPATERRAGLHVRADLSIDWSSQEAIVGVAGALLGVGLGVGVPIFYISRDTADEEKLSELRELNRKTFKETGEYLTEDQIREFRKPRWTDRREFQDDD
ncbi:hypothetical protein WJX84_009014 [Apatococcus fuscideae]|uniref:Uncharacterized protein n=1 Tax=Apatococcus fuscideae TaxID=2026836 RepID=A0AAW1T7C9_9CHLO